MTVNTVIGAYRQADLERMEDRELREVRDWAGQEFNRHLRSHGDSDETLDPDPEPPMARPRKRKPTRSTPQPASSPARSKAEAPRRRPPSSSPSPPAPSMIRDMSSDERPRQRLLRSGGDSLSDAEVLAVVLGNGCREVCTLELAREILEEAGGLQGLVGISSEALQRRGLGKAKAASVLANLEIARRLAEGDLPDRVPLIRPYELARYLYLNYAVQDQEVVGALLLEGLPDELLGHGARLAVLDRPADGVAAEDVQEEER